MSKTTVTINGQQLADQARVSLVAGDWTIKASDPQAFVNVGGNPRARGQVTLRAEAGRSYNVAVTGGFFAVLTATAPVQDPKPEPKPTPRAKMLIGTSTTPGNKRRPSHAVVYRGVTLFRLVSSDGKQLEQAGGYEDSEIDFALSIDPKIVIVASIANGWKTQWMQIDEAEARAYARRNPWILRIVRLGGYISGPNEPEIYGDGNTPAHIAKIRQVWAWIVDELIKMGVPRSQIGCIEWYRRSLILEDCDTGGFCGMHTHDDGRGKDRLALVRQVRAKIGPSKKLFLTETSYPADEPTWEKQADGMAWAIEQADAGGADGAVYYVGVSDPKELHWDFVAILNPDGTPREAMLTRWYRITGWKPVESPAPGVPAVLTVDQQAVFDGVNRVRDAASLPRLLADGALCVAAQKQAEAAAAHLAKLPANQITGATLTAATAIAVPELDAVRSRLLTVGCGGLTTEPFNDAMAWGSTASHGPQLKHAAAKFVGVGCAAFDILGTRHYVIRAFVSA